MIKPNEWNIKEGDELKQSSKLKNNLITIELI